jgi:hypothetical protein
MVGEPSHVKQLSLNHRCKIGLIILWIQICNVFSGMACYKSFLNGVGAHKKCILLPKGVSDSIIEDTVIYSVGKLRVYYIVMINSSGHCSNN